MIVRWSEGLSFISQLEYLAPFFFQLYLFISIYIFGCLGSIARVMYSILNQKIARNVNIIRLQSRDNLHHRNGHSKTWQRRLQAWKIQYFSIGEFVHQWNRFFAPFLLLAIATFFVKMINNSFGLLTTWRSFGRNQSPEGISEFLIRMSLFFKDTILFCGICIIPHLVRKEVM